jgi:hypothetical protein
VVVVADEPTDVADEPIDFLQLVSQYILRQLRESGLQGLTEARQQLEAQLEGAGSLGVSVGLPASAEVTKAQDSVGITDSAEVVLRGVAPKLAIDIEGRSPRDIKLTLDLYTAFLATLTLLVTLWTTFHHQPPTPAQITQIFNQTTTFVQQTINMPPPKSP